MDVPDAKTETYTDEQVTAACGLHLDNLRRLITWGAVTPVQSGGGRGRIRRWTARQALRISVTAQFVEAGFSLQMAHTLTYCLPLDDLIYLYDPDIIRMYPKQKRDVGSKRLRAMITPQGDRYWPGKDEFGREIIILDRRFVYADLAGKGADLMAVIDPNIQRVAPRYNPYEFYQVTSTAYELKLPQIVDAKGIARSSLLIDDDFLLEHSNLDTIIGQINLFDKHVPRGFLLLVKRPEDLVCKNFSKINLAVGLTLFVRSLLKLPVKYHPFENKQYED